ncbi:MAG: zinc ribbon domain-containing protein [Myxococcota bacterium]|nr:zinc ribbon domain-containing protein [Myxococcota bacterium]
MPIYEYQCAKCSHEFEREQRMADPPVKTCPECKGRKVTKLISRSSFVLKGGGWYADGYSDAKKSEKPDKSVDGDKTKDSSSSSPDAKTEKASSSDDSGGGKKKAKKSGKKTAD